MKKITNTKFQKIILRAIVSLAGCVATLVAALFMNDIYGVIATLMVGGGFIATVNSVIN